MINFFIHNKIITHIPKVALENYLKEEKIESDRTVCDTQSTRNSTVNIEEDDTSEDRWTLSNWYLNWDQTACDHKTKI